MTTSLPFQIRIDIEGQWDSPKSSLQTSISALSETLGFPVEPKPQWVTLWEGLQDSIGEEKFVPRIAWHTANWYDRLNWRLEHEEGWAEEFRKAIPNSKARLEINMTVEATRPSTGWVRSTQAFYLVVPKEQKLSNDEIFAGLDEDFEHLLTDMLPSPVGPPVAQVSDGEPTSSLVLPTVDELDPPGEWFVHNGPHILTVDRGSTLFIRGSHQPSLELLAKYFQKWGKHGKNDSGSKILEVDIIDSDHFAGAVDAIRIQYSGIDYPTAQCGEVNPTPIIALIEGVLEYDLVKVTGGRFVYRSKKTLKLR